MSLLMSAKWDVCGFRLLPVLSKGVLSSCLRCTSTPRLVLTAVQVMSSLTKHHRAVSSACCCPGNPRQPKKMSIWKYLIKLIFYKMKSSIFQTLIYIQIFSFVTVSYLLLLSPTICHKLNCCKFSYFKINIRLWWNESGKQAWNLSSGSITDHCVFLSLYQLCSTSAASVFPEEVFVDFAANVNNTLHYSIHFFLLTV